MSKQEMLMLSTKDRDRLKILHEVKRKHLTQRAAAQQLGVSDRWVRELLRRVKKEGDRGVVHRGRGRVSNRRLPESVRTKTLKLVQAKYRDFGPRLYLVAMIDDATSQAYARFARHDSTEENLRVLWGYLKRWGRPVEFYTDKSSLFTVNAPQPEAADEAVEEELTQIGRALREME